MRWWYRLWRRKRMEELLDKELRFHLEQHASDLIADSKSEFRQVRDELHKCILSWQRARMHERPHQSNARNVIHSLAGRRLRLPRPVKAGPNIDLILRSAALAARLEGWNESVPGSILRPSRASGRPRKSAAFSG